MACHILVEIYTKQKYTNNIHVNTIKLLFLSHYHNNMVAVIPIHVNLGTMTWYYFNSWLLTLGLLMDRCCYRYWQNYGVHFFS